MKKIITIALIGALVLGMAVTGVAFAKEPPKNGERHAPPPMMGTVAHQNANSLVLTAPGMDFISITITTNTDTTYYDGTGEREQGEIPPEITIADIKKGDKVVAHGKVVRDGEDSPATYVAVKVVKVDRFPKPERPGDKDREQPPTMNVLFKSANGDTITVITPDSEKEFEVVLGEEAKVFKLIRNEGEKATKEEIAIGNLSEGDKLVITAFRKKDDDGNVTITAKFILLVDKFPPQRDDKGRGNAPPSMNVIFKSVSGNTLTVTDPSGEKEFEIIITDETKFAKITRNEDDEKPGREEISLGDLSEGDKLVINGKREKNDDGNVTITARMILVVENFPKNDKGRDGNKGRNGDRGQNILGTFDRFDGDYMIIKPVVEGKDDIRIKVDEKTQYVAFEKGEEDEKPTRIEKTRSDLESGQVVGVMVARVKNDDGEVELTAKVVVFHEFLQGRAGGEITAINAKSITIELKMDGSSMTFEITDETRFELHERGEEPVELKKSDFKKGDIVGISYHDSVAMLIVKRIGK